MKQPMTIGELSQEQLPPHWAFSAHARILNEDDDETTDFNDSEVLRDSIMIYGGLLLGIITIFSWLRLRFPQVYNVRNYVDELKTHLAEDQFRFFSWMWGVYMVTDDELMEECGMDAACFVRLIRMGYRLR